MREKVKAAQRVCVHMKYVKIQPTGNLKANTLQKRNRPRKDEHLEPDE